MAREQGRLPVVLMAALPVMAVRLGAGFLLFQARRKRGVRIFRASLVHGGMPKEQATRLAQDYHDAGSLRKMLQSAGLPRFRAMASSPPAR